MTVAVREINVLKLRITSFTSGHRDKINTRIPDWVRLLLCKAPGSAHAQNARAQTRLDHTHKHHSATTHISWQKFNRVPDSPHINRHSAPWNVFTNIFNIYSLPFVRVQWLCRILGEKIRNGMWETPSLTRTDYMWKWRFHLFHQVMSY